MKFVCLGYYDPVRWRTKSESEQKAFIDECFAYDDVLRASGNLVGGDALESARNAATVRWKSGKTSVAKGPVVETKLELGGILVLEAADLDHAVRLIANHPGVKAGPFEIRPVEDMSAVLAKSRRRRAGERKVS